MFRGAGVLLIAIIGACAKNSPAAVETQAHDPRPALADAGPTADGGGQRPQEEPPDAAQVSTIVHRVLSTSLERRHFELGGEAFSIELPSGLEFRSPDQGIAIFEEATFGRGMRVFIQLAETYPTSEKQAIETWAPGSLMRSSYSKEQTQLVELGPENVDTTVLKPHGAQAILCQGIALIAETAAATADALARMCQSVRSEPGRLEP